MTMDWKRIFNSKVAMSLTALFLFIHFTTILTLLMMRVLRLEDAYFVTSLEAVGGFFRDSSLAAFLVTLMRHNFPKEALKSLQAAAESRRGGYYNDRRYDDRGVPGVEHPWDDIDYQGRVEAP